MISIQPVCSGTGAFDDLCYQCSTRGWTAASGGGIHGGFKDGVRCIQRFILDSKTHQYFGYDMLLQSTERPEEYRLVFEPLSLRPDQLLPNLLAEGRWAIADVERLPPPRMVRLGDTVKFDFATADGKHNLSERIELTKRA